MKPLTKYYGGKQWLAQAITHMMPAHTTYVEPFCGAASVFFHKKKHGQEIINDTNNNLCTFYRVIKTRPEELKKRLEHTLYSRYDFDNARTVYLSPDFDDEIEKAWAVFVCHNLSYAAKGEHFSYGIKKSRTGLREKIESDFKIYSRRMEDCIIECVDALKLIEKIDHEHAFFNIDPPYLFANQGHYKGYNEDHFTQLLRALSVLKGKFVLSYYPNDILNKYTRDCGWWSKNLKTSTNTGAKKVVEILTCNYISNELPVFGSAGEGV